MRDEVLMSIARHWVWATWIRDRFGISLKRTNLVDPSKVYLKPAGAYMLVWYGLLFAVCEELRKRRVAVPEVQKEIDSLYSSLKQCRNATFHVQRKYWSRKLLDFITVPDNATKVHGIHDAIGKWLYDELQRRGLMPLPT